MATATYQKFNTYVEKETTLKIDWDSDVFKVMLTNVAPNLLTNGIKTDITEIAAGNGYTAGGIATTISCSRSVGVETVQGTQVVFTAVTASMATFQYAILYDTTVDALVAMFDYGAPITLGVGESLTVKFNNASPGTIFTKS